MRFQIEQALKYPSKDSKWAVKLLILGATLIIPIVNVVTSIFAAGYIIRFLKSSIAEFKGGAEAKLPEWDDMGKIFMEGLMPWVVCIMYGIVFSFVLFVVRLVFSMLAFPLIAFVLLLVMAPVVFVALAGYCQNSKFEDAFKVKEIFNEVKSKWLDYIIAGLISCVVSSIGFLACYIGGIITLPYGKIIGVRMMSQVYCAARKEGKEK
ncbi:DUF4013 domain-containing protein [bacterium]|jgi:hypothetical protein|nr:DUF4013 domain-containing protein [bacterium]